MEHVHSDWAILAGPKLFMLMHVVLKPQIRLVQWRLLVDSPPAQGHPSISDPMTKAYETDLLPGKIVEAIWTNSGLQEITVVECEEGQERVRYRGSLYLPDSDELQLQIIQAHCDAVLTGHPGRAKTFDLPNRDYYWKEMRRDFDRYVWNCHDCTRSRNSWHSMFGVLRPLPVPDKPHWETLQCNQNQHILSLLPLCYGCFVLIMTAYPVLSPLERSYENVMRVLPYVISNCRMIQISHTACIASTPFFQSSSAPPPSPSPPLPSTPSPSTPSPSPPSPSPSPPSPSPPSQSPASGISLFDYSSTKSCKTLLPAKPNPPLPACSQRSQIVREVIVRISLLPACSQRSQIQH